MKTFKIVAKNNSSNNFQFCIFQRGISSQMGDWGTETLAWKVTHVPAMSTSDISWADNYCFVHGKFQSGKFQAAQSSGAQSGDRITLSWDGGRQESSLRDIEHGRQPGFTIMTDATIPPFPMDIAMGIGMAEAATFIFQGQTVSPHRNYGIAANPEYYIAAVASINAGDALNNEVKSSAVRIAFPDNGGTMYATLNSNNTWTVSNKA